MLPAQIASVPLVIRPLGDVVGQIAVFDDQQAAVHVDHVATFSSGSRLAMTCVVISAPART